jgi:competence protein ComGC
MAKLNRPDFDAVKRRFIELYVRYANQSLELFYGAASFRQKKYKFKFFCRKPPPLTDLPKSGRFSRLDAIRGTYKRVLRTLMKYEKKHFHSPYLHLYSLQGIAKNICHLEPSHQEALREIIIKLAAKYELDEKETKQIISTLNEHESAGQQQQQQQPQEHDNNNNNNDANDNV